MHNMSTDENINDTQNHYERFGRALANRGLPILEQGISNNPDLVKARFRKIMTGDNEDEENISRTLTIEESEFAKLFSQYLEVFKSFEAIKDLGFLIGRFPYARTRVTRVRYLRYHIESYFHELYIIKKRLIKMANTIRKLYSYTSITKSLLPLLDYLDDYVNTSMSDISDTRSKHVHVTRYTDTDLERLDTYDFLAEQELLGAFRGFIDFEYRDVRKKWRVRIISTTDQLDKILNLYFRTIGVVLINPETRLLLPCDLPLN